MYTQPNSTTLTTPLGQWHASYSQDYEWAWRIHEPTQTLYHHHRHVWYEYRTLRQRLNNWLYSPHQVPQARIPADTTPVTPKLNKSSIVIALPIVPIIAADPAVPLPDHTLYQ